MMNQLTTMEIESLQREVLCQVVGVGICQSDFALYSFDFY
jgi:hypothetical protein